jgi:hypothetical protein
VHSSTYSGSNRILLPDNGPLPHAVIDNADWAAVDNIFSSTPTAVEAAVDAPGKAGTELKGSILLLRHRYPRLNQVPSLLNFHSIARVYRALSQFATEPFDVRRAA